MNHEKEGRLNQPNPVKITSNLNTLEYAANFKFGKHFEDLGENEKINLYKSLVTEIHETS
jgi:hypothetical protein